ncbi:hypothetical protein BX666DRAFT_1929819 [Dichotomocladium elegans]|nr:hypothetical protein BX666DRAFT_1929819 [Dichotomocladium elegans]
MAFKKATKNRTNALFDTCVALEKNLRSLLAVDREVEKTEASEYNEQHSSESTQQQQEQQQDYAIQVVNKSTLDEDMDTSVLLIPLDIMEQFWAIGIAAPVMLSEVEQTLAKIGKRKEELERQ